ncbi:MAG TPA: CAP domain-containing protein [Micropepsaceae bacterium]|nr:CAP domain-containing protein [Micropepsaceae bacterium]
MRRLILAFVFSCGFIALSGPYSQPQAAAPTSIVKAEEDAENMIAERIDEERVRFAATAPKLLPNGELHMIARSRSNAMAHGGPFSHQDAQGNYPAIDMVKERLGSYGHIGENIFMEKRGRGSFNPQAFAKIAVDEWMKSEEHRENILSPDYDRSGIGVVVNGDYAYATQVFHGPIKSAPKPR